MLLREAKLYHCPADEQSGQLIACDLHPKRVGLSEKRAKEMGLDCINAQSRI